MHTTHWSHATKLANVPPTNLVQIGIGGWIGNHSGIEVAEQIDTTVITMFDVDELGIDRAMTSPSRSHGRTPTRSTCPSTSTSSIPASPPAPAPPSRAA